jgi:hypothetical protein
MLKVIYHVVKGSKGPMLPWIHLIRHVHHRSSHEYLHIVTVRGEGKGETVVTTPDRLDWFSGFKWLHVQLSYTHGRLSFILLA